MTEVVGDLDMISDDMPTSESLFSKFAASKKYALCLCMIIMFTLCLPSTSAMHV